MRGGSQSIDQFLDRQINKWNTQKTQQRVELARPPLTITISRETGCGASTLARALASELGYDLFDYELIQKIAESAQISAAVVQSVDERFRTLMEDWLAEFAGRRRLWFDDYLRHLGRIVSSIGRHGRAVIVGRGAHLILGRDRHFNTLCVRLIAPLEQRVAQWAKEHGATAEEAAKQVARLDADRREFIRKYFNATIDDPLNYDLVLNMGELSPDEAVAAIAGAARRREPA
jgi:cytidylate kinase